MLSPFNRFDRLIAESEARIEEQRKLIIVFGELGMSTLDAERHLIDFEKSLKAYMETREAVLVVQEMLSDSDRLMSGGRFDAEIDVRKRDL